MPTYSRMLADSPPTASPLPSSPPNPRRVLICIVATPLNLVLLGLHLWAKAAGGPRRFLLQLGGAAAAVALALTLALTHYQHLVRRAAGGRGMARACARVVQLCMLLGKAAAHHATPDATCTAPPSPQAYRGFYGRSLAPGCSGKHCPPGSEPNCNFPQTTPWVDLLPQHTQNIWTGSQHCRVGAAMPHARMSTHLALPTTSAPGTFLCPLHGRHPHHLTHPCRQCRASAPPSRPLGC